MKIIDENDFDNYSNIRFSQKPKQIQIPKKFQQLDLE